LLQIVVDPRFVGSIPDVCEAANCVLKALYEVRSCKGPFDHSGATPFNCLTVRKSNMIREITLAVCALGWGAAPAQPISNPAPRAVQVLAGDFNGDGKPDLLIQQLTIAPSGMLSISVYPGKGDGTFSTPLFSNTPWTVLTTADFNGDGKLDLVLNGGDLHSYIALGNGDGTFRTGSSDLIILDGMIVGVGDFNGDDKPDLLSALFQNNGDAIYLGNGDGTFRLGEALSADEVSEGFLVLLGDVNLDGKTDIVTPFAVLLSNGDGSFRSVLFRSVVGPISSDGGGTIVDMNGDGYPDIVYTKIVGSVVETTVLFGNGDGTFRLGDYVLLAGNTQVQGHVSNPVVADFHLTGAQDVVFASNVFSGVQMLNNRGDGTLVLLC
jgi:hypothetical protein